MQTKEIEFIPLKDISSIDLEKHIFIEASAGTGKTYTITRILLRYILEYEVDYKKIILLTFTNKATQEMLIRVREIIQNGIKEKKLEFLNKKELSEHQIRILKEMLKYFDQIKIATIHSFCKSLLSEFPFELNIPTTTEIINNTDSIIYEILLDLFINPVKKGFDASNLLNKKNFNKIYRYVKIFLSEINKREDIIIDFIDESILLSQILKKEYSELSNENYVELIKLFYYVYQELDKYTKSNGIFSYDDLVLHLYKALKNNESFRKKLQEEFNVCIVDEFQDTDPYQWKIFEWIFVENPKNKLVIVGDPKQSIYGFRGADFYAYENAKNLLKDKANFYQLEKSYRSTREFIEMSNLFFEKCINANRYSFPIKYHNLISNEKKTSIYQKYKPVNFIEIQNSSNGSTENARQEYSKKIVAIIKDLVYNKHKALVKEEGKKTLREIQFSDIAILIRNNTDATSIINQLKFNNIPFTNYSQDNVFNTPEATAMKLLLEFFANPKDISDPKVKKRFITYYFIDIPYTDISKIDEYYSKIQESISSWLELLEQKNWYKLFYKIIEDTKLYYKYLALPDYERKITNYEQIMEILVEAATQNHYGPIELYNYFLDLQQQESEEYNLRLESEENKVHLLTMHKSKGLEFPVVFLFGWFTNKKPSVGMENNYKFYNKEKGYWNICFFFDEKNKQDNIKEKIVQETLFEELRLLYVAFTRAKSYVFLPKYNSSYMKEFISDIAEEEEFQPTILKSISDTSIKENVSISIRESNSQVIQPSISELLQHIKQIESISYHEKRFMLHSYTSLTRYTSSKLEEIDYDEKENISTDTIKSETEFDEFFKAGAKTGIFIHKIYEMVDFNDFKKPTNKEHLLKKYKNLFKYFNTIYSIYNKEELDPFYHYLIEFLEETLNHKINEEFALCELNPDFIKKEIGFLIQDIKHIQEFKPILDRNFFTGNLDLFFEHNKKFYLLDYKTNKFPKYDIETLKNYTENHYKIQYLLYSNALYLWLNQIRKIDLKQKLPGGIIYYYVRGYKETTKGIYYKDFFTFEEIHQQLKEILCNPS
jgi:exodeoxyribonuclease V beta subunit